MLVRTAKRLHGVILELKALNPCWPCGCRSTSFTSSSSYAHPSKLLINYLKLGEIDSAYKLFDEIPHRDIVIWSIMIHGYAKNRLYKECLDLFSSMRLSGLTPNSFTVVGVLGGIVGLRDLLLTQCFHGFLFKRGLISNSIVITALLDTYAKCASVSICYQLFKQMDRPSLVSCNALLAGLVYNNLFSEAVSMFIELRQYSLVPSSSTALSLIKACIALGSLALCESVHALTVKLALVTDVHVSNSILKMYSSFRNLDAAEKALSEIEFKDAATYSTIMKLFNELDLPSVSLNHFLEMKLSGIKYDLITIIDLISVCTNLGDLRRGKEVHAHSIVVGHESEPTLLNSIIAMYAKCGDQSSSMAIFDQIRYKSIVSWSAIISGFIHSGKTQEAMEIFKRFQKEEVSSFDLTILVSVLKASGQLPNLELCQQLHTFTIRAGFSQYASVVSSLISAYSKCGNIQQAENVFQETDNGIRNLHSWNAILSGLGMNGHGRKALLLFDSMLKSGVEGDSATYVSVLAGCSHGGLVKEGIEIFEVMVKENRMREEHLWCVVDLVARSGCVEDMNFLGRSCVEEMMGRNAWKALLSGCLVHGNAKLGEYVAKRINGMDEEDGAQTVLVSNVFASAGRFEDSEAWRAGIDDNRVKKTPGISYV